MSAKPLRPIQFLGDSLRLLDQTRLPFEEVYLDLFTEEAVAAAIREMRVRGAPAIGVAAAYGVALAARHLDTTDKAVFMQALKAACQRLSTARPTAVNLGWAVARLWRVALEGSDVAAVKEALSDEALRIDGENQEANRQLAQHGATLLAAGQRVLTHCNTGALATGAPYGTALGVIQAAWEQGKRLHVLVDETRPLLQGARLTTWELQRLGIPCSLVVDGAAGHLLKRGAVDAVIVGADRIAANGDTANKIGTYTLAVMARQHGVPFYVAAPTSTIDASLATGEAIPIEERDPEEVRTVLGRRIAPEGVEALNPAFDVTPHELITAIITERGVVRGPEYGVWMAGMMRTADV